MRASPGRVPLAEPIVQAHVSLEVEFKPFRRSAVSCVWLNREWSRKHGEREGDGLTGPLPG